MENAVFRCFLQFSLFTARAIKCALLLSLLKSDTQTLGKCGTQSSSPKFTTPLAEEKGRKYIYSALLQGGPTISRAQKPCNPEKSQNTLPRGVKKLFGTARPRKSNKKRSKTQDSKKKSWLSDFSWLFGLLCLTFSVSGLKTPLGRLFWDFRGLIGCLEKGWNRQGVRLQYLAAATTLETCLEHLFTQPFANKLLQSKQQRQCNSSSTIASYCVAWTIARTNSRASNYCSDTPCGIHPFSKLPI